MGCEGSEVHAFSVGFGAGGTLGGSSVLKSEKGYLFSSILIWSVSLNLIQGLPFSHRSIEWGSGRLQTNHELGKIVVYPRLSHIARSSLSGEF